MERMATTVPYRPPQQTHRTQWVHQRDARPAQDVPRRAVSDLQVTETALREHPFCVFPLTAKRMGGYTDAEQRQGPDLVRGKRFRRTRKRHEDVPDVQGGWETVNAAQADLRREVDILG